MQRFVVLEHSPGPNCTRPLHWDLLVEQDTEEAFSTWALELPPDACLAPTTAHELPAHRLAYWDYQGPLSDARGSVRRWDRGQFTWCERCADNRALELVGDRLQGIGRLTREVDDPQRWRFTFSPASAAT